MIGDSRLNFPLKINVRYLAEILAGQARCFLDKREVETATAKANEALELHAGCGDAFFVRGQVGPEKPSHHRRHEHNCVSVPARGMGMGKLAVVLVNMT